MIFYSLLFALLFLIDFFSKKWALLNCKSELIFNKFISCKLVLNRGVIWSLFHSSSESKFIFVTAAVFIVLFFLTFHTYKQYALRKSILGEIFVLAGGFSNIFDRFIYSGVVDFIIIGYKGYIWPVFNLADSFVLIGVSIMLIKSMRG